MFTDNQALTDHPSSWGQLLMVGIPGPRVDAVARELVRDLKVGGVILFARNIESPEQVWELTRDLQREALAATGRPLLLAVDQEGGRVQRLKTPFTLIPPARELGKPAPRRRWSVWPGRWPGNWPWWASTSTWPRFWTCPARRPAPSGTALTARTRRRRPATPLAAIRGYLAGGIIPVAKHFPGLGDTVADSHEVLPLAQSADPKREVDLLPFRRGDSRGGAHGHDRPPGGAGMG